MPANQLIIELLDLDMEPKPESLWWTSTHAKKVEDGRGKSRDVLGDAFSLRLRSVELALQEEGERDVDILQIQRCFEQRVQCWPQRERQWGLEDHQHHEAEEVGGQISGARVLTTNKK